MSVIDDQDRLCTSYEDASMLNGAMISWVEVDDNIHLLVNNFTRIIDLIYGDDDDDALEL